MFPFPKELSEKEAKWRKENPKEAAAADAEINAIMNSVVKKSLEKYGVQPNGCYRIDDKLFLEAIRDTP